MNKIIVSKLYTNKTKHHDIDIYTCYHFYNQTYFDVVISQDDILGVDEKHFCHMLFDYQQWFNRWLPFYVFCNQNGAWMDIFKTISRYYVHLQISRIEYEYNEDICFMCKRSFSNNLIKWNSESCGIESECKHYFCGECLHHQFYSKKYHCPVCDIKIDRLLYCHDFQYNSDDSCSES